MRGLVRSYVTLYISFISVKETFSHLSHLQETTNKRLGVSSQAHISHAIMTAKKADFAQITHFITKLIYIIINVTTAEQCDFQPFITTHTYTINMMPVYPRDPPLSTMKPSVLSMFEVSKTYRTGTPP